MSKIKELALLEQMLFDSIEYLEKNLRLRTPYPNPTLKIRYQSGLAALDILNEDYKQLTGKYFVDHNKVLEYYSKQWEF